MTLEERKRRRFSESFKREHVSKIESGELTIADICRRYQVRWKSVKGWQKKYGNKADDRILVTDHSDVNRIKELEKEVAQLKSIIGDQQVKLIYQEHLIQVARRDLGEGFIKKVD